VSEGLQVMQIQNWGWNSSETQFQGAKPVLLHSSFFFFKLCFFSCELISSWLFDFVPSFGNFDPQLQIIIIQSPTLYDWQGWAESVKNNETSVGRVSKIPQVSLGYLNLNLSGYHFEWYPDCKRRSKPVLGWNLTPSRSKTLSQTSNNRFVRPSKWSQIYENQHCENWFNFLIDTLPQSIIFIKKRLKIENWKPFVRSFVKIKFKGYQKK
jgi:hypothetical protein